MHDIVVQESLETVLDSLGIVMERFKKIASADDFVDTDDGIMLMDSISMRLQLVGEKIKKIDQKSPGLLEKAGIDPYPIIRFRDFISHHYDKADHEVLFDLCKNDLPVLKDRILQLLRG
ncbi:MAG: DUF86 domain-containing protein [Saprospiraceae bacterium]|nr:DUF86 domain-containing protein [Saprospiraceae bacterium]